METSPHVTALIPRHPRRSTALLAVALLVAPLFAACSGGVSATEVRTNGTAATATATPGAPRPANLVPPGQGAAPKQPTPVAAPAISARAAIVIDDVSGAVLYESNSHTRLFPASLTKIATAALAIDRGNLDRLVTIDFDLDSPELDDATEMGLDYGDRFTLRDLIYGMLLPSGADASLAIAHAVAGSEQAFVQQMNAFMESLGLFDTHFLDPHGIGGPTHVSSAYDIAMLSRYALRQPLFAKVVDTDEYKAVGSRTITVGNTNPWMFTYPGANGVKSGFTEQAGPTLSASATRSGHRVIVVVLDAPQRNADTTALMDWAFNTFCWNDRALGCAVQAVPAAASTPVRPR